MTSIQAIRQWTSKMLKKWSHIGIHVIADSRDNSVTFSSRLFKHLRVFERDEAKVYVFTCSTTQGTRYAFTINPTLDKETQLSDIQYNQKHKCFGFECLLPTVNRIFYDYGIPTNTSRKLSVTHETIHQTDENKTLSYYIIHPPHEQSSR